MRPALLICTAMISSLAFIAPAFALEATDTMQAWKSASDKERSDLLKQLLGEQGALRAGVSRCMTEASATPGHADLPIGEVAKACASAGAQPV